MYNPHVVPPLLKRPSPSRNGLQGAGRSGTSAVGAEDIEAGHQEATTDERRVTAVAVETVVVPVAIVKRYKLS